MVLSNIDAVRLNVSDKPHIKREAWTADGVSSDVQLALAPVQASPVTKVWKNDVLQAVGVDYTLDLTNGIVSFVLTPAVNDDILVEYYATAFADAEIQHFLDTAAGDLWLASAYVLLAMAVDAARIARRETLAGGGVFGQATIDTSVRARELREQAKGYIDLYNKLGAGTDVAADGITQVIWTDAMGIRWTIDQLIAGNLN